MHAQAVANPLITLTEAAKITPGRPSTNGLWRWKRKRCQEEFLDVTSEVVRVRARTTKTASSAVIRHLPAAPRKPRMG